MNLQFFDFSRRAHLAIESNGCVFALQNCLSRGNHVEFSSVSLFSIVVQSVTTEVVTLCTTVMIISPPIRDGSATPEKTKWELVIRDKNFLDLNTKNTVDTRFVLLFLEFTKKDISECLRAKL